MLFETLNMAARALIRPTLQRRFAGTVTANSLANRDPDQVEQMKNDFCIVVDQNDKVVGAKSKLDCHMMENINKGLLHRAFSVLLFNDKKEFLLTQRAEEKITFPGYFTNACCSHPAPVEEEMDCSNDMIGIKRAAQRRLEFELGINKEDIPIKDIHFMTRLTYVIPCEEDPMWGEHELDYVLVINKQLDLKPNTNELKYWGYVNQGELDSYLSEYIVN